MRPFDPLLAMLGEVPTHAGRRASSTSCPTFCCSSPWSPAATPSADRDLHQGASLPAERRFGLRWKRAPAHTAIPATFYRASIRRPSSRCFVGMPRACWTLVIDTSRRTHLARRQDAEAKLRQLQRPQGSPGAACLQSCGGPWCWRMSRSMRSPTKSPSAQRLLGELLNSANRTVTLDAMHCQKTIEAAAAAQAHTSSSN